MILPLLVAALVGGVAFLVSHRKPWAGAAVALALLPWEGLAVDPGLRLPFYRLALFGWIGAMGVRAILDPLEWRTRRLGHLSIWAVAFFGYAIGWTALQIVIVPEASISGAPLRAETELRSVTQIGWLVLRFTPIFLLPAVLQERKQAFRLVRFYLVSLVVLVLVGWVQVGTWWVAGIDVTPIGGVQNLLGTEVRVRHGLFTAFGRQILRMSSLGGEPKGLGQSLAVGLLLVQGAMWLRTTGRKRLLLLWAFLLTSMVATFSTSALYVWAGGTVVLFGYLAIARGSGGRAAFGYGLALLATAALVVTGAVSVLGLDPGAVQDVAATRTVGRRVLPDFDTAVLGFLGEQPLWGLVGVGLGNIHTYAMPHLPAFALDYAEGQVFVAKSGYLRLLSEIGLIGLGLFIVWMWREISQFGRTAGSPPFADRDSGQAALRSLGIALGLVMVLAFLARGYLWNEAVWTVAVLRSLRGPT